MQDKYVNLNMETLPSNIGKERSNPKRSRDASPLFNTSFDEYECHPKNTYFWDKISKIREDCFTNGANTGPLSREIDLLNLLMDKYKKRVDKSELAKVFYTVNKAREKQVIEQMKQNLEMNREVRKKFESNDNVIQKVRKKQTEIQQLIDLQKKVANSPYKKLPTIRTTTLSSLSKG